MEKKLNIFDEVKYNINDRCQYNLTLNEHLKILNEPMYQIEIKDDIKKNESYSINQIKTKYKYYPIYQIQIKNDIQINTKYYYKNHELSINEILKMKNVVFFEGEFKAYDCRSESLFKILEKNDLVNLPNDSIIKCFFIYITPIRSCYVVIIDDIFYYCDVVYEIDMKTHKINYNNYYTTKNKGQNFYLPGFDEIIFKVTKKNE